MPVKIVTSIDLFATYRRKDNYYIDKTGFIETLLTQEGGVLLFTRPRRFGKTLFMSMLAEFFDNTKDSRDLFAGLKVAENEALCREWMNQYPVISLSLKDVDKPTYARALTDFQELISEYCRQYRELLASDRVDDEDKKDLQNYIERKANEDALGRFLRTMSRMLCQYYGKPTIVLIDEYDAPVTRADTYGYYNDMIGFMRRFLSPSLKSNPYLCFGIVTGCLRIAKESLFSELNNLKCCDISCSEYADIFGFTQAEVDKLLLDAGLSGKRGEIKKWYDGYCFGENQEIYCPWSIMNYVADAQKNSKAPRAYWLNSGKNDVVRKFVARHVPEMADDIAILLAGGCVVREIETELSHEYLEVWQDSIWSLLYLAGYLTRASEDQMLRSGARPKAVLDEMALVIPNQEVRKVFAKDYVVWFQSIAKRQEDGIDTALWEGDAERLVQLMESILLKNISSRDLASKKRGKRGKDTNDEAAEDTTKESAPYENFYHAFLTGFLLSRYPDTLSNREIGKGFFDIRVIDDQRGLVMEVKRTDNEKEDLAALAKKGLEQIEERRYNVDLADNPDIATVLHWSLAFCRKDCAARAIFVKRP